MADEYKKPKVEFVTSEAVLESGGWFQLQINPEPILLDISHYIVIDIYDQSNTVHPDGHVGWWRYRLSDLKEKVVGQLYPSGKWLECRIQCAEPESFWQNEFEIPFDNLVVMAVLRSKRDDSIVDLVSIPGCRTNAELDRFRIGYSREWNVPRYDHPPVEFDLSGCIRIYSRNIFARDAVGNFCLEILRILKQHGVDVQLYAENFDTWYRDVVRPIQLLPGDLGTSDQILYFYSTHDPNLDLIKSLYNNRKLIYFHGITNPSYFTKYDEELAHTCRLAMSQLPQLAGFDKYASNSNVNASVLLSNIDKLNLRAPVSISVIPPKLVGQCIDSENQNVKAGSAKRLLYVGRIKAHKKVEDILRLFSEYLKFEPTAELFIVGFGSEGAYWNRLQEVQYRDLKLPASQVHWTSGLSDQQLNDLYFTSSVYVSMSEDEGFCLPIYESMRFKLPVFAYSLPAIVEVTHGHAALFSDKKFRELAFMLHQWLGSGSELDAVVAAAKCRADELTSAMNGKAIWEFLSLP